MLVALFCPPRLDSAAFPCDPLYVARDLGWCDHDYTRWGGHNIPVRQPCNVPYRARRTGFYHRVGAPTGPPRASGSSLFPPPRAHAAATSEGVVYSKELGL